MVKGILHLHLTVVIIFLISLTIKTILLLVNNRSALEKIRAKTKVLEMILGTLILLTGGYLMFATKNFETYIIVKLILVFIAIPLGIVGLKRSNKVLTLISLLLFIYIYGIAETKSIKFKRERYVLDDPEFKNMPDVNEQSILEQNEEVRLKYARVLYINLCARCHGENGQLGTAGAKDLSQSILTKEEMALVIAHGKGIMPGFEKELSEQDIDLLVDYVNTFRK